MNRAVFIDRDGVLNIDKGYVYAKDDFEFTRNAPEAIRLLNHAGYQVIVISNQSGVGRGFYTEEDIAQLHHYVQLELANYGARIDGFYYCPHHPKDMCDCRKPSPKLVLQAALDFGIDLTASWFIGDKESDILCAVNAETTPVYVGDKECQCVAKTDFYDAVIYILEYCKY